MGFVIVLVVFALIAALAVWAHHREQQRKEQAAAVAVARGYTVSTEEHGLPSHGFDQFRRGEKGRSMSYVMRRAGHTDSVFEFTYQTESQDSEGRTTTSTHHVMCAMIAVAFHAPSTKIGKEGFFSKIARSVGRRDIEVESPEFNDAYKVHGDDERFAVALLAPATINAFIQEHRRGTDFGLEFLGPWMLVHRDGRFDASEMIDFLEWSQHIPSQLPEVLPSLYPTRPERDHGRPGSSPR